MTDADDGRFTWGPGDLEEEPGNAEKCLSCGCGLPHDDHGDDRYITVEDLEAAADAADLPPGAAASNIAITYRDMTEGLSMGKRWGVSLPASELADVTKDYATAWQHELRDSHGRWVASAQEQLAAPRHPERGWRGRFEKPEEPFHPSLAARAGVKDLSSPGRVDGTGTPDDPIDVQGNLDRAAVLLARGLNVRLNQPDEISLLANRINDLGAQFRKTGKLPPVFDFGKLTVRGTNLFTAQSKGIPRISMPQLGGVPRPGTPAAAMQRSPGGYVDLLSSFKKQLESDGVKVNLETVPVSHLRATQSELNGAKVAGIAQKFQEGDPFVRKMMAEPLWVTRDNYVVDGHHRWAAGLVLDAASGKLGSQQQNVYKINMDIGAAIPYANAYSARMGIGPSAVSDSSAVVIPKVLSHEEQMVLLTKDWATAWQHEARDIHGRWTGSGGGAGQVPSSPPRGITPPGKPLPGHLAEATRSIAVVNRQANAYTDEQVKALQNQLNSLQAEMHREKHKEAKTTFAIRITTIMAAIALTFITHGASLALLGPMMLEKMPDAAKEITELLRARGHHTENPLTRLRPGEKADTWAADQVAELIASEFLKAGMTPQTARQVATGITAAAAVRLREGAFPGDDDFVPDSIPGEIISSVTGPVTKKWVIITASELSKL